MESKALLVLLAACTSAVVARPMLYEPSEIDPLLPKGYEVLPEEAIARLRSYHFNRQLTMDARRDRIEAVFDELPESILDQLPLAPGLARLPAAFQAPFHALQVNRNISWRERMAHTRALIAILPLELQHLVEPPTQKPAAPATQVAADFLPSQPPAGFEQALSPTLYAQLLRVHADSTLDNEAKKVRLNAIMRMVPREQLERLPLPAGWQNLPEETLQRARPLLHDFSLEWNARHAALQRFVAELPVEQQRAIVAGAANVLAAPQTPLTTAQLPAPQRAALLETLADRTLDAVQRFRKVEALLDSLPADVRARVPTPQLPVWTTRV